MSRRTEMIGSTLQQELMSIIMRELNDPRISGLPTITRVKVATDLSTADVFVTVMGSEGKQILALNALKHSAGLMRAKLQKTLPMRTIPFLKFHLDEALKKELSVLDLIQKAVREEDELKAARGNTDDPATEPAAGETAPDAAGDAIARPAPTAKQAAVLELIAKAVKEEDELKASRSQTRNSESNDPESKNQSTTSDANPS